MGEDNHPEDDTNNKGVPLTNDTALEAGEAKYGTA
jgi:hypothetical protein